MNDYICREDTLTELCNYVCGELVDPCNFQKDCKYYRIIKSIESADVVQVRPGRWKKIGVWGRVYRCNQCGNFLDFDGVNAGRGDVNFCPNCGAKMDGGES